MKTTELEATVKGLKDGLELRKSKVAKHDLLVMWGMYELARVDRMRPGRYTIRCHNQMTKLDQKKLANAVIEYSMTKPEERGCLDGIK